MDYLLLKWIHILSSTILFGTGIGSAFYMFMANRRKDIADIYFATRHVVIADWLFTTPAVFIQLGTGLWLVHTMGYSLSDCWIMLALALYFFAGACWVPVVWMQIKMRDMAKAALDTGTPLPAQYWLMDRWWMILGSLAFPAIVVVFYLMVFKPDWPSAVSAVDGIEETALFWVANCMDFACCRSSEIKQLIIKNGNPTINP